MSGHHYNRGSAGQASRLRLMRLIDTEGASVAIHGESIESGLSARQRTFERVVARERSKLTTLAIHLIGSADADDVVQETLCRCWRHWNNYRAEVPFYCWARAIMRNLVIDLRRRKQEVWSLDIPTIREDAYDIEDPGESVEGRVLAEMEAERLAGMLSPEQQPVFRMTAEGYGPLEIGNELGIPRATARTRLYRARRRLRSARVLERAPVSASP